MIPWWHNELPADAWSRVADLVPRDRLAMGPVVAQLETEAAALLDVPHAIVTTSCSSALLMSLMAIDIGPGDEVIIPCRTFIATAHAVLLRGAQPVLVDVEADRPLISAESAAVAITPRTKAIIAVHLCGRAANICELRKLAEAHGLTLIEDAAQAFYSGTLGTQGDIGCYSFGVTKFLNGGHGGMLVTRDAEIAKRLRRIRNHGIGAPGDGYDSLGFNFKPTEYMAALVLQQLRLAPERKRRMQAIQAQYAAGMADIPGIDLLPGGDLPLWTEVVATDRNGLEALLAAQNIGTMRLPENLSRSPHLLPTGKFPNAQRFEDRALIIPSGPQLSDAEIATVLDALRNHTDDCRLCGAGVIADLRSSQLPGASSDDKPRPACPPLTVCQNCGHVQKMVSPAWQEEIRRIYAQYDMYQNADGEEPLILGAGLPRGRSDALLQALGDLPPTGRLLDFGCGHGSFIKTIQQAHPGWTAAGFDSNPSYREEVMSIPGVESYDIEKLPEGPFDLITAIYVMEHVTHPVQTLLDLKARLTDDGRLMFVVPHFVYNAFDLMVVDHLSHFTHSAVAQMAQRAGFEIETLLEDCIPRALVVILRPGTSALPCPEIPSLDASLGWLCEVRKQLEDQGEVGVFGTGTASAWCAGVLGERAQFYVDEATNRVGRQHLGKPILAPAQVPTGATIYVGLPMDIARRIGERLAEFACEVILPVEEM